MADKSSTQNVLDMMTAGVMGRKASASATLTPVGSERVAAPAQPPTPAAAVTGREFPFDNMREVAEGVVRNIRRELAFLEEGLRSIEREYGLAEGGPAKWSSPQQQRDDARREAERKADQLHAEHVAKGGAQKAAAVKAVSGDQDETFAAAFARKQAAAQAAVFSSPDAPTATAPAAGWRCPVHGKSISRTSPRGRVFLACPKCAEFE